MIKFKFDGCMVEANWREIDCSFDHAFGCEKRYQADVTNIAVTVEIGGSDVDVTEFLRANEPHLYNIIVTRAEEYAQAVLDREEALELKARPMSIKEWRESV